MSNKVPQIRFNGYSDPWVQRKFGELYKKVTEKNDLSFGKDKIISVANMYFKTDESRSDDAYMRTYNIFRVGDIAFEGHSSKQFAYGRFVENTIGDGIVSHIFDVFRPISNYDLQYWKYAIINEQIMGRILMTSTTQSTMMNNLVSKDFLKRQLAVPTYEEQAKIGAFLESLDKLIAANQRKLDLLKEQKKGYLQKMFPKNGAKVPELRFAGFADDWEERKLGDHAKYRRGSFPQPYGNKEWYDGEGAMPFVQVVDVTNKLTLVENTKQKISKLAQSKSVFVPKGKVVVTLQGSIGRVAITQYDSFVDRTLLIFENYEKETDERFWAYTIQKKFEIEKLKAPGGTIKTITKEALSSFDVHLPKFEEQQKIGSFFRQLDETIALHQRKLDLLKEQKKGFLQKMFS
ncbi:restriction endonuclease subunit S [Leuconostoc suionicum]|uniref:restriction endonuclease subunit S n=1 Tax=Leuconostoc suionicum TaxID=1511761 RepID=UPI003C36C9D3